MSVFWESLVGSKGFGPGQGGRGTSGSGPHMPLVEACELPVLPKGQRSKGCRAVTEMCEDQRRWSSHVSVVAPSTPPPPLPLLGSHPKDV